MYQPPRPISCCANLTENGSQATISNQYMPTLASMVRYELKKGSLSMSSTQQVLAWLEKRAHLYSACTLLSSLWV